MTRTITALVLGLSLFAVAPASAANLGGVSCEDSRLIEIMEQQLRNARDETGSLQSHGVYIEDITRSRTLHASANKLVCAIAVKASGGSASTTLRLRFTYEFFASGKKTASITPM